VLDLFKDGVFKYLHKNVKQIYVMFGTHTISKKSGIREH